ncbi:embryonic stem cell-specific 5-hydroxymethylcytosine-binding protein [Sesamum indicum]|uniref:Embryonic stem cell-specific 5-hydroxymethylcytosine-binding protein n=1 Tax=Sesamum indicum TaxID=4182 RepID=A0A6I9TUJ8_SESIN|nr:embryonic stem cell-specific 5-hydroxymethylcytosine-binding protein [Sesamum indicum]
MCGRGRGTLRPDDFPRACHLNGRPVRHLNMDRYQPSYNVAPGFNVPVVRRDEEGDSDGVVLHCMKWGLIPSFTKKNEKIDHFRMFNARCESIREKASFRRLLPKNRCLVSFEGFYEWKKDGLRKQPYYIHFKDGRPLIFAGLFDSWRSSEGEILYSFTIVTTTSSSSLEWLHDRMPVVLGNKESTDSWLNDAPLSNLDKILKPYEGTDLAWYPVTTAIGKLSLNGPECIKEIQIKTEETKSISQFFSKKDICAKPPIKKEPVEATEQESMKNELENQSTLENKRMKAESVQNGQQKSVKEEPESQLTLDNTTVTAEPVQNSQQKSVKEEPQSQSTVQNRRMEGEPEENSQQKSMKEEHDESQDDYRQTTTKKDDGDNTCDIYTLSPEGATSSIEKRDYSEFSAHAKPSTRETERRHTTPVKKKSKGADDKQPTLFSYFGRS